MPHPVVHFELGCRNLEKTQAFYGKLFDWQFQSHGPAAMINTGSPPGSNINGHLTALGHEPHNYTLIYVMVDDIEAHCKKAESLGGSILIRKTEVPGMGHFAWIKDPEGTPFGLWKPMKM
jgi:predicted enzyme related to lactoylglutathione lyase